VGLANDERGCTVLFVELPIVQFKHNLTDNNIVKHTIGVYDACGRVYT